MKSCIAHMRPLALMYAEFYGLKLGLDEKENIKVSVIQNFIHKNHIPGALKWLKENKSHAVNRLKLEGWIE